MNETEKLGRTLLLIGLIAAGISVLFGRFLLDYPSALVVTVLPLVAMCAYPIAGTIYLVSTVRKPVRPWLRIAHGLLILGVFAFFLMVM